MATLSLQGIPNSALAEWIETHLYYMPESISKGECIEWMETMQTLIQEAEREERLMLVKIAVTH